MLKPLAKSVDIDLWHFKTDDGRSIRKALDFLIPYAQGDQKWEGKQITDFNPHEFVPLLQMAARAYKEPKYAEIAAKIEAGSSDLDSLLMRSALDKREAK